MKRSLSAPVVHLRMDAVVDGVLQCPAGGEVGGGTKVRSGDHGNYMKFTGSLSGYIRYPANGSNCYQNPKVCDKGVTFAFWIWMKGADDVMIFSTGQAAGDQGEGYGLRRKSSHALFFIVKYDKQRWFVRIPGASPQQRWEHFVFTWDSVTMDIRAYFNGCDIKKGNEYTSWNNNKFAFQYFVPFVIGCNPNIRGCATMFLDEMIIWEEPLDADQVWSVFARSGGAF